MATKILVRRGVIADLDQETLDEGELGFTTDTLGLYVGSDTATEGYVKINKTDNIEYDGNALTSVTDTDNLKEAIQNIDVALKTEKDNVTNITNGTTNISFSNSNSSATNVAGALSELLTHKITTTGNPHSVTASEVGLGNVTNESKATMFTNPTFTGTVTLPATGTGATEAARKDYVDTEVATKQDTLVSGTNIKTIDSVTLVGSGNIEIASEWKKFSEINSTSSSVTINSSNLGESFDNANYDYKFVVLAQTDSADTTGTFSIRLDNDSTAGKHSFVRHMAEVTDITTLGAGASDDGSTASLINTGLKLGTGDETQGNQTLLQVEFIISQGLAFSTDNSIIDNYPYIVRGSGSVIAVEASNQIASSTVSYTKSSIFTGGFLKSVQHDDDGDLTSVVLSNLPDAGTTDTVKIRVYKRER